MESYSLSLSLSDLIRPRDIDSFLDQNWGRVPCVWPQALADDSAPLMTLSSFEYTLATLNRAHEGWLYMARGGRKPVPPDMIDAQGMVDLRKLRSAFANGETLYLTKAERLSHPLMHLARSMELELIAKGIFLREPVSAHVFLTPPGSQGFPPHRDEHASFVLQLDGSKEWSVYPPLPPAASQGGLVRPGGVDPSSLEVIQKHNYQLRKGDMLYMPEWWPHEAKASNEHSLHVTFRIFPLRWVDVMLEICADHSALSDALPRSLADNPSGLLERSLELMTSPLFRARLPDLLQNISRRHSLPRTALPDDGFRQALELNAIELDTCLARSTGTSCQVFEVGGEVCIGFAGGMIRGPAPVKPVFEFVASVTELCPLDLPSVEGVTYDRLEVARTLVKDGLLKIAMPAAEV